MNDDKYRKKIIFEIERMFPRIARAARLSHRVTRTQIEEVEEFTIPNFLAKGLREYLILFVQDLKRQYVHKLL